MRKIFRPGKFAEKYHVSHCDYIKTPFQMRNNGYDYLYDFCNGSLYFLSQIIITKE